jgi:hypothetical protein
LLTTEKQSLNAVMLLGIQIYQDMRWEIKETVKGKGNDNTKVL